MSKKTFEDCGELLTMKEVQEVLGLSKAYVYEKLVNEPGFPLVRFGRKMVVPKNRLQEWLDEKVCVEK